MIDNAWVGTRYDECGRVLILLESTWGKNPRTDMEWWIDTGKDATYKRLYGVLAAGESRAGFAAGFALDNVAIEPTGTSNADKVTPAMLRRGTATLARATAGAQAERRLAGNG